MTAGIEEFELAFLHDPSDVDAFAALQRFYKEQRRLSDLAALYERRATHMRDHHKAADLLWRASELHREQVQVESEGRVLQKALELHKGHARALERQKELAREQARWTDVVWLLEQEAEVVEESGGDGRRLGRIEHEIGVAWEQQFHRLDRAIHHYQRAFKADPLHTESIEAGRRIYRSVGHWKTVASLYDVELTSCSGAQRKVELLLELAKLRWEKLGDLEAAAKAFQEASQLRPGDESIMESLGEIYASPEWPTPGGLDKAASIFMQIAQTRQSRGNRDEAVSYLRRALGADPENEAAYNRLEKAYEETGRWEDLDRLYRQRLSVATEVEAAELLMRRGELLEKKLGDRKGARECYESVLSREPLGGPASTRLHHLYRADKDYDQLLELNQRALDGTTDRATRIRLMLEMAFIYRDQVNDSEAAAHLLHEVLQIEPDHRKALTAYEDYFRQKGDYRNLAELVRFAAQSAAEAGAPAMEICAKLEELADVSERHLGDLEGAVEAWQQIGRHHPDVQRSKDALGRIGAKMRMWQNMVNVLDQELAQATSPAQRQQALRRMAQVYYEKKADPQRTITILRELLQMAPHDENALRMLIDLYERESDHEGQAWTLSRKLDGILTKQERVTLLRQLGGLFDEKLDRPRDALRVYQELLESVPSDSKTHDRVEALLERIDDLEQLARSLEYRSQVSRSLGEQLQALKNLAHLVDDRLDDPARAAAYWEEVRAQDAEDPEALEALSRLYDRTARSEELLEILRLRLELCSSESTVPRANILRQIGAVANERLGRFDQAAAAYERLSEILPGDRETLDALAKLYARQERYTDLVGVLQRQIELSDDPEQRVVLAFKQGDVLEEKLSDLEDAAGIYERIIEELSPGDLDAHRKLKQLYLKRSDFRNACEIAEREFFLTEPEAMDRLALALEIASLWREKVQDAPRAVLAYERVLELSPDNRESLVALRRLYHQIGAHSKLVNLAPALFAAQVDDQERLIFLLETAEVYERSLNEPESAFEWYRRAHDLYPDDHTALGHLRRLALEYGLWEELITAHVEARKRTGQVEGFLELTRQVSQICLERLNDPPRAFQVLQQGLQVDPTGAIILEELEELAERAHQYEELLEIYDRVIDADEDPAAKQALLLRKAEVAEATLGDPGAALDDMVRLSNLLDHRDATVITEVERLAAEAGRVETALNLHAARLHEAALDADQLAILRHVAALCEEQLGALERAFKVYLQAFALAPADELIVGHLWRLAAMLTGAPSAPVVAVAELAGAGASEIHEIDEIDEIDEIHEIDEVQEVHEVEDTQEISLEDLEEPLVIESERRRPDQTIDDPTLVELDETDPAPRRRHTPAAPPPPPRPGRRPPPPPGPGRSVGEQEGFSPWSALAQAYLSLTAGDDAARIEQLLAVAEIWRDGAHDIDSAIEALAEAAMIDIEHPELEWQLTELAERHDRFPQQLQIYIDALERAADAESLTRLQLKVGDLLTAHGRPEEAERHFNAVLVIQPSHADAAGLLKELFRVAGRWQDMANLQKRQLEVLAAGLSAEERYERLLELVELYQHSLERPFEAVEYLTHLVAENPHDLEQHLRLADLFEELSIWPKLIETLGAAVALTGDTAVRAGFLLRIARTYDDELELPDRAIEAYQQILTEQPHNIVVLEALERLYEVHDRPEDLLEVLKLQVELAESDPGACRPLLVRLAAVLEQQGETVKAGARLQLARSLGPPDPDIEEALARILVQTGRPDEAVELIQDQIKAARREERGLEEVASLMVRLARLQADQLSEVAAARETLEEALGLQPRNPEVLDALADYFQRQEAWGDFVETLVRLADVSAKEAAAALGIDLVARLSSAAKLLQEQGHDGEEIKRLYEQILELDPANLDGIDALIELCAAPGTADRKRLQPLLELKVDLVDDPEEQAQTQTRLGRTKRELGASADEASAHFQRALELQGDFVPALDALSELYVSLERLEPARVLLVDAIERLGLSRETGPLYYRLGQIFEHLDRDEEGYRYLSDALRLDPRNMLLRIAVGQNRFKAQRWREALRHLQEVHEHPDVPNHAELVADVLYQAGQCEINLKRSDRAGVCFEGALELNPQHHGAVSELARMAVAASDWEAAAGHLRSEVSLIDDPLHRNNRLKTLGEIYRDHLGDVTAAAECFSELFEALGEEEATRLEVLPQILPALREAGRHEVAARVAESLAQIMWGDKEKLELLQVAAREWEAAGALEAAEEHYQTVLGLDPGALSAAASLSRMLEAQDRVDEVIQLLTAILEPAAPAAETEAGRPAGGPPPLPGSSGAPSPLAGDEEQRARAEMHATLGRLHQRVGDEASAITNLQCALELDPEAPVRGELASLYGERPEYVDAALVNHRELLAVEPGRTDSLGALARAQAGEAPYRAYCLYQALEAVGGQDAAGEAFLAGYTPPTLEADVPYAGEISDHERWEHLSLPQVHDLREIFATLWEAAPALFSRDLSTFGVTPDHRVSPVSDSDLAKVYSASARALGLKQTALYLRPEAAEGAVDNPWPDLQVVGMAPPAVIVSNRAIAGRSVAELRFLIGRTLELTQPAYILAAGLPRAEFARLLQSVLRAFHPRHMRGRSVVGAEAMEQAATLRRMLPFKVARKLGELFRGQTTTRFDSGAWRQAVHLSASRVGLALCGDLNTALRLVIAEDLNLADKPVPELLPISTAVRDLVSFAVSDAFFVARAKLGLAG